jgi:hypothetical protein
MSDLPPPPPPPPPGAMSSGGSMPSAGEAFGYGWKKFQANVGPLLLVVIVPFVALFVLQIILRAIAGNSAAASVLVSILAQALSLAAQIGAYNAALMITRGETVDFGRAFTSDRWGEWILFAFVYGIATGIGIIACGVGYFFAVGLLGLAPFYFLDQRMSLGDSLSASWNQTRSGKLVMPIALIAFFGFLGLIACCVGVIVTQICSLIAIASIYRRVTGQPVAA